MLTLVVGAVAVLAGVLLGYVFGKSTTQAESRVLRERVTTVEAEKAAQQAAVEELRGRVTGLTGDLGRAEASLAAEKNKYAQMQTELANVFGTLAADALRANNQSFLTLAKQELGGQTNEAKLTLEAKEQAIRNLVGPIEQALNNLDQKAQAMETTRAGAYSEVKTLVETMQKSIPASLDALKYETAQLVTALRAPKTRGNWGELQLKRCVEYTGMVQYCSFIEQVTARDEDDNILRPDMTIKLPNGREIVVDAKTPLDAFLDAGDASDATSMAVRYAAHAQRVKTHLKELASKAYWKQFENAPDFVVCFLPSEALFSAALEADPSLIEYSAQNHVVMATPTTLIALLRAVAFGWQQSEITEKAKEIHEVGLKIYEKLVAAQGHVERLGNALSSSVDHYNKFLGSIEGRQGGSVFYHGRRLSELVHADKDLPETEMLQPGVRAMESPEWAQTPLALAAEAEKSDS
jgi:DNA recombination protein RmuC